jgi:hypothetical protein
MVCQNLDGIPLTLEERCLLFKISMPRAKFLLACAHDDTGKAKDGFSSDRGQSIPYDERVLLREAFRLGMGFADTARMMQMTETQLATYGIPFPAKTSFPKPPGKFSDYNLFTREPIDPIRCYR